MAGTDAEGARYSAFLSYSHSDAAFVQRLHGKLESYRLPRRLRRNGDPRGRLAPLFVDRAELTAAPDLGEALREAIASSEHLIVVCSPAAAASAWVGREIGYFHAVHPYGDILTALCDGDEDTAFHAALLHAGPDGTREPIAADFRKGGDGERLALLKLMAPLAGVRLDELVRRDSQRRTHRMAWIAAASAGGLAFAGGLGGLLFEAQSRAQQERDRGDQMITYMVGDERAHLKAVGRLDLLDNLNAEAFDYFRSRRRGQLTDTELSKRAELLCDMADDDIERGDFRSADGKARDALASTAALLSARPTDPSRVFAHAQGEFYLGYARRREGDAAGAQEAFQAYASLANRLVSLHDARGQLERAYANSDLATLLLQRDLDTGRAGILFSAAQADFEAAAKLKPGDSAVLRQVLDGYGWLADVARLESRYVDALGYRARQRMMLDALLARDHRDFQVRAQVVGNELGVSRIEAARGDWRAALARLQRAHEEALGLADLDPENNDIAEQVRAIELFEARTLLSAPANERPVSPPLVGLIGDCAAEGRHPNHAELAEFCTALRARSLAAGGKRPAASTLIQRLRATLSPKSDRLSERWLINWQEELAI